MRRLVLLTTIATVLLLAGATTASAATSAAQMVSCTATTWCFSPNPITITAGSSLTWKNGTAAPHTATSNGGNWTTGTIAARAMSAPVTFTTPGSFAYHCAIHPFMTGTIVVTAATATTAAPSASSAPAAVTRLAQGGGGPGLLVAAVFLLLGLALFRPGSMRRRPRGR